MAAEGRTKVTRVGGRQKDRAHVLYIPQTDRQMDNSTVLGNKATAAAKEKNPFAKQTRSSRHIQPRGGPPSPSPRALAATA